MKKQESTDDLCTTKIEKDNEAVFSGNIIFPIILAALHASLLLYMVKEMKEEITRNDYYDQFKNVWWIGPGFFTTIYLFAVYFGPKYMENKKEFKIKPYIFIYNLYQCVFNAIVVGLMIYEIYSNPWFKYPWVNIIIIIFKIEISSIIIFYLFI